MKLQVIFSILLFNLVSGSEGLNPYLKIIGIPELSNGWWLSKNDNREVSQSWGGLEDFQESPPGGLIYKAEIDLNGDGYDEVILRWTTVGNTWEVFQQNSSGELFHKGSIGNSSQISIIKSGNLVSFPSIAFGPNREAVIYEYNISKDLEISYTELGVYPADDNLMMPEIKEALDQDIKKYLKPAKKIPIQKALMLDLLNNQHPLWLDTDGVVKGTGGWRNSNFIEILEDLDAHGKLTFQQARKSIIENLGASLNPRLPKREIELTSMDIKGNLISEKISKGYPSLNHLRTEKVVTSQNGAPPSKSYYRLIIGVGLLMVALVLLFRAFKTKPTS